MACLFSVYSILTVKICYDDSSSYYWLLYIGLGYSVTHLSLVIVLVKL